MTPLDVARSLIAEGIYPVPIGYKQKKPTDPRTGRPMSEWQNLRIDETNVAAWFGDVAQNVGAILGEASGNLHDVDLDCAEAIELAPQFLPPSRGFGRASKRASHLVYRCDVSGPTRQFKGEDRAMLVELRANGGQTVMPGSTHESGEAIEWTDADVEIAFVTRADLEAAVERLAAAVKARRYPDPEQGGWDWLAEMGKPKAAPPPVQAPSAEEVPLSRRIARAIGWVKTADAAISGSGGHDATMRAATGVACGFALDAESAFGVLRDHFRAEPRWSDAELRHKVKDALGRMGVPWGSKLTVEDRGAQVASAVSVPTPAPAVSLMAVPLEWITQAPPKRTWLLRDSRRPKNDGVLPLGKVGQIVAEGGAGKTNALVQLAIAVATGGQWLGTFQVVEAGRALLVLGEEDAEEARRRLFQAARALGVSGEAIARNVVVLPLASVPCALLEMRDRAVHETAFLGALRAMVRTSGPWKLVALDPLSRFAGPEAETDNAGATRFVQVAEALVEPAGGATVLLAHHSNKTSRVKGAPVGTVASRGASALTDGFRWVATLGVSDGPEGDERLEEIVTISFTKSNYGRAAKPLLLRRDLENGGVLLPLDGADAEAVEIGVEARNPRLKRAGEREEAAKKRDEETSAKRADAERRKTEERDRRFLAEELAVIAVLRELPGVGLVEMRARVAARLPGGSNKETAALAIARLDGAVHVIRGETTGRSLSYRLVESKLTDRHGGPATAQVLLNEQRGIAELPI